MFKNTMTLVVIAVIFLAVKLGWSMVSSYVLNPLTWLAVLLLYFVALPAWLHYKRGKASNDTEKQKWLSRVDLHFRSSLLSLPLILVTLPSLMMLIKTGKLWVGGICFVFLVGAMFELAQAMGKRNFIFTKMEEGTCKIVLRLGQVYRILWLFRGREKLTEKQAALLNTWLKACKAPEDLKFSDPVFEGDIIELDLLSSSQRVCIDSTEKKPFLELLVDLVYRSLGGLQLIGIPSIDELYIWRYSEVTVEKVSEPAKDVKGDDKETEPKPGKVVLKEVKGPVEVKNFLRLSDLTITFLLPSLETAASLDSDSGIGASMDVVVNLGARILNPYKATFVTRDPRKVLSAIILPFLRQVFGETPPGDVVRCRDLITQRVKYALKGVGTSWKTTERGGKLRISGVRQRDGMPDGDLSEELEGGADNHVALLRDRYGLEVIWVEVGEVNASTLEDRALMTSAYRGSALAEEKDRTAAGEASRYKQIMKVLAPDESTRAQVAVALLSKEAVVSVGPGSTPVVSFGGTAGSGPDATSAATLAALRQISGQLAENAEALKAATKKAAAKEKEA